eukprot:TRINITY_DN1587_c0_g1_i1.p1 TRINITY_DN1587_c0_g1~~TRINITY_DN1587_c0_g1_i1.p1  ORF type:complete len:303 (-),score=20.01 TRINITY_DN1587_c0_g1_i1:33-941(-)
MTPIFHIHKEIFGIQDFQIEFCGDKFNELVDQAYLINTKYNIVMSDDYTIDFVRGAYSMCYDMPLKLNLQTYILYLILFIGDDIAEKNKERLGQYLVNNDLKYLSDTVGDLYNDLSLELHPKIRATLRAHINEWLLGAYNFHMCCEKDKNIDAFGLFSVRRCSGGGFVFINLFLNHYPEQFPNWIENLLYVDFAEKQAFIVVGFNDIASARKEKTSDLSDNLVINLSKNNVDGQQSMLDMLKRYRVRKDMIYDQMKSINVPLPLVILEYDIRLTYWQCISKRYLECLPLLGDHNFQTVKLQN